MSERFSLGEVAIVQNSRCFNGEEVTVAGLLRDRLILREDGYVIKTLAYAVEFRGQIRAARSYQLRKKRPPGKRGTWDAVKRWTGWRPGKQRAAA